MLLAYRANMIDRLNILDRLHTRLLEIVATGLPLLASSIADADLVGLAHLRGEMIAAIDSYARYVHDHVLGPAMRGDDAERLRLAHRIKVGAIQLQQSYHTFTTRWADRDGMSNWPEYRLSAIVMMKQVRDQVREASRWEPVAEQSSPGVRSAV